MAAVYQRKEGIMAADMNGETVMMDITTGKYYNLGEVGGEIWNLLESPISFEDMVSKLTAIYNVSAEQCSRDTRPFFDQLLAAGLILKTEMN